MESIVNDDLSQPHFRLNYSQVKLRTRKPLPSNPSNDPFHIHKAALRPLLRILNHEETTALFNELESFDLKDFITFLYHQGLAQMWLPFLLQQETLPAKSEETIKNLKQDALATG